MADTMTSQNIDLSSWDNLYMKHNSVYTWMCMWRGGKQGRSAKYPYHLSADFVLNQHALQNQTWLKKSWTERYCILLKLKSYLMEQIRWRTDRHSCRENTSRLVWNSTVDDK